MRWGLSTVTASHFRPHPAGKAGAFELSAGTMLRRCLALFLTAALAACAGAQGDYPSLDIRPAERATGMLRPVAAEPIVAPAPQATLDRVAQLAADGRANHQAFLNQVAGARPAITAARGATIGDDAWARAEAALADVRAARSRTMVPLADLDRLYVDAATQSQATDRIAAARDEVSALVAAEDRTVSELSANLP
jgi:hypothetical protein